MEEGGDAAPVAVAAPKPSTAGDTVKLKGLPFKATHDDVQTFFSGFVLFPSSVFLRRHPDGRPNGEVRHMCTLAHAHTLFA
jgi:hypothetical protein